MAVQPWTRFGDEQTPMFVEALRTVLARKWIVLAVTLLAIAIAVIALRQMTPIYRSTATLLIEQGRSKVVSIEEIYSGASGTREYLVTQAEFLKSRNVAERVIRKLDLTRHVMFAEPPANPGPLAAFGERIRTLLLGPRPEMTVRPGDVDGRVLRTFERGLDVQPVWQSQLVSISFESPDRTLAAEIANAVATAYVEADMDARYAMVKQANAWLTERVAMLRTSLVASEQALQAFRDRKGVLDRQSSAMGGSGRQLEEATQRLVEARMRRTQAEQAYNQALPGGPSRSDAPTLALNNPAVARANDAAIEARRRLADVSQRFGASHPLHQTAETELAAAERNLRQAVESVIVGLRRELEVARAVERQLEQTIASTRGSIQGQNRDEFELASYEREVAANRQLYETFLGRLREMAATSDQHSAAARVLDAAVPAMTPTRPSRPGILVVSALLGLMGGVGCALLLHRMDGTLRSVEAAESRLHHPVIAALPKLGVDYRGRTGTLVKTEPSSAYSEAVRTVRTSILLSSVDESERVVVVTSAVAGEGKSTFSSNLALAQSQVSRTLLIEADMRRPTHAKRLGLDAEHAGLHELVAGTSELSACVQRVADTSLDVITSGRRCTNPLELLSSRRFQVLLETLRRNYETIVIDSPPLSLVSDATLIVARATAVVFVVRAGSTPYRTARHALRSLENSGIPVLGLVLNGLDFERARRYHGDAVGYAAGGYGGYGPASERGSKAWV